MAGYSNSTGELTPVRRRIVHLMSLQRASNPCGERKGVALEALRRVAEVVVGRREGEIQPLVNREDEVGVGDALVCVKPNASTIGMRAARAGFVSAVLHRYN